MTRSKSATHPVVTTERQLEQLRIEHVRVAGERARMLTVIRDAHALAVYLIELIAEHRRDAKHGWLLSAAQKKAERLRDALNSELDKH